MKRNFVFSAAMADFEFNCAQFYKAPSGEPNHMEISGGWLDVRCKFPDGSVRKPFILVAGDAKSGEVLAQTITIAPGHVQAQFELIGDALSCAGHIGLRLDGVLTDCGAGLPSQEIREFCALAGLKLTICPAKRANKVESYLSNLSSTLAYVLADETVDLWRLADALETYLHVLHNKEHA